MDPKEGLKRFWKKAEDAAGDLELVAKLTRQAQEKYQKNRKVMADVKGDLMAVWRMLAAYAKGDYREVPWKSVLVAVGATIYFINPLDLIPDMILGSGLLDDVGVLTYAIATIKLDLEAFKQWEKDQGSRS